MGARVKNLPCTLAEIRLEVGSRSAIDSLDLDRVDEQLRLWGTLPHLGSLGQDLSKMVQDYLLQQKLDGLEIVTRTYDELSGHTKVVSRSQFIALESLNESLDPNYWSSRFRVSRLSARSNIWDFASLVHHTLPYHIRCCGALTASTSVLGSRFECLALMGLGQCDT